MNEVQSYNLHSNAAAHAANAAKSAETLALRLMIAHLRVEHNMGLSVIAKRCGLKMKQVKLFLENIEE
jgi:hypothetical protein